MRSISLKLAISLGLNSKSSFRAPRPSAKLSPAQSHRRLFRISVLLSAAALLASGQPADTGDVSPTPLGCPSDPAGYTLRNDSIVKTRFNLLGSLDRFIEGPTVELPRQGDVFSLESAQAGHESLRASLLNTAGELSPFRLTLVKTFYGNCTPSADEAKELDLTYEVIRFGISPPNLRLLESARKQTEDPSRTAVDTQQPRTFSFRPDAGYNASDGFGAGGALDYAVGSAGLTTIEAGGHKYSQASDATFAIEGSRDFGPRADSMFWTLAYDYSNGPSGGRDLRRSRGRAQFHALLPALSESIVTRIGSAFEFGNQTSSFDVEAASNTLASASYSSAKVFVGATGRTLRHAFAASYGLQLGSTAGGKSLDYYKHIADIAWEYRRPFADHRSLELETALMLGKMIVPGNVPVGERFFGGNVAMPFVQAEDWRIRAAPLIRSMPNRGLSRLSQEANLGGENYFALNLTLAATAWRLPLLPPEISREPDFDMALRVAKGGALGAMIGEYQADVPRTADEVEMLKQIADAVPPIVSQLEQLEIENSDTDWFDCTFITADIKDTSKKLQSERGVVGQVTDSTEEAITACREEQKISEEQAESLFGDLLALVQKLQAGFDARPDVIAATARARREFKLPNRAIDAFTNEMNLLSISPLAIFDAARIGPQASAAGGGMRYGVGAGVRFGLASHVNFDIGYAFNPDAKPWEGRGAFFFSMRFLELFR